MQLPVAKTRHEVVRWPTARWTWWAALTVLVLVAACAAGSRSRPEGNPLAPLDGVVGSVLRGEGYGTGRFLLSEVREPGSEHFIATYMLGGPGSPPRQEGHWILEVSIAVAGGLIDAAAYAAAADPNARPPIGSRYLQVDRINVRTSYAPPGMFTGIAFSTNDGRFDVQVTTSNLLPEGVSAPEFDANVLGARILARYEAAQGGRPGAGR